MTVLRKRAQQEGNKAINGLYIHSSPPRVLQLNSAYIKQIIRSGDVEKLEQLVLEGQGKKLLGEYSADYKTRTFLKSVQPLMSKISLLHDAVNNGRLEEVQSILEEDPGKKNKLVASKDESGAGLLHKAVYYDKKNIYRWLLEKFPHLASMRDAEGRTPYHYTPMCKDPNAIKRLLKTAGADPSAVDNHQRTVKYYEEHKNQLELPSNLKTPVPSRKSIQIKEGLSYKKSNIRIWIHQRNMECLQGVVWGGHGGKLLVEHSNNAKMKKFLETVPHIMGLIKEVHCDVQNGDLESLISHSSPPIPAIVLSARDSNGLTPLHKAAGLDKMDIAKYILKEYPDCINATDKDGRTPLHYAAILKDDGKMMSFLIDNGADESALDNKQKTAAYYKTRSSELDAKLLNVIPECPRTAKDTFPIDWSMLVPAEKKVAKPSGKSDDEEPKDETSESDANVEHDNNNETNEAEAVEEETKDEVEQKEEAKVEKENIEGGDEEEVKTNGVDDGAEEKVEANDDDNVEASNDTKAEEDEGKVEEGEDVAEKAADEAADTKDNGEDDNTVTPAAEMETVEQKEEENSPENNDNNTLKKDDDNDDGDENKTEEEQPEQNVDSDNNVEDDTNGDKPKDSKKPHEENNNNNETKQNLQDSRKTPETPRSKSRDGKSSVVEGSRTRPQSRNQEVVDPKGKLGGGGETPRSKSREGARSRGGSRPGPILDGEKVIEGVVEGDAGDKMNNEGINRGMEEEEEDDVEGMISSGNMEKMAALVLNGEGRKLVGRQSDNQELQSFLDNVPVYMSKINKIHEAARNGSLRDLQAALDRRKFAIAKDPISPKGASPLHVAVIFGNTNIVRYLAGRFPETVQVKDDDGRTPLHYAAVLKDNGHYYSLLVHLGADVREEDNFGRTPEYYRTNQRDFSHRTLLSEFGAEEDEADEILADKVPDDTVSSRKDLDDEDMLSVLERCYAVIQGRRSSLVSTTSAHMDTSSIPGGSWLSKHCRRGVFDACKLRVTKLDHNLYDLIWPSVKRLPSDPTLRAALEQDFPLGIVAPDYYSYRVFRELLEPILKDYNFFDPHRELQPHPESRFKEVMENEKNAGGSLEVDLDPQRKMILADKNQENGQVDMPFFATEEGRYLASSLGDPLIKGLTEVANKRPDDPIAYLAQYLYNFANNRGSLKSRGRTQENQQLISANEEVENQSVPTTIDVVTVDPEEPESDESAFNSTSRDEHGQSMLHFAAARGHGRNALFQLLLETEINVAYRDELYRTARDISIQANLPDNTEEIDRYVLHIATKGDTDKLVELLLDGYDHITDIVDDEGVPIVEAVSKANQPDTVSFLQSILAFEEKRERVHHAIRQNNLAEVKALLADENDTGSGKLLAIGKNSYGRCSLHIAVLCQQEEIVDYLVNTFPDVLKLGDNLERTALHYAMGVEKIETISRVLIKAGAKRITKDLKGRQPTYYYLNKSDILRLQEEEETF